MVSLARGAASSFKMRGFAERRASQLTMARKFTGREAASAARKVGQAAALPMCDESFDGSQKCCKFWERHKVLPAYSHADLPIHAKIGREWGP